MRAIENKVLVQVQRNGPTEKIGSFVLPDDPSGLETATVISVGDKVESVKEGETVYIYGGAGKEFMKDGQKYRIVSLNEIVVVL